MPPVDERATPGSGQRLAIIRAHTEQVIALDARCTPIAMCLAEPGNVFVLIVGPDEEWVGAPDDGKGLYE